MASPAPATVDVEAAAVAPSAGAHHADAKKSAAPESPAEELKKLKAQQEKMEKAIKLLQNPRSGAKGEELAGWQQLFIKVITPKLVSFDKPFRIAVASAVLTLIACALIFWALVTDCTTTQSFKNAAVTGQMAYVISAKAAGTDICVHQTTFLMSLESGRLEEVPCMPEGSFTGPWPADAVDGYVRVEDLKHADDGIEWCAGSRDKAIARCTGDCPVCSGSITSGDRTAWNTVFQETTCTNPVHSAFWTYCISGKIELLTTFIMVVVLMATGAIKQYGPTGKKMGFSEALKNDWGNVESLS